MPPPEDPRQFARLTDAIAAFLAHDDESEPADKTRILDEHAELRDLLEPMLLADADDPEAVEEEETAERYVGDFRLVREIGRGGMGVVYEAIHVPLGRRVALKVLPAHITLAPLQVERFRREAAAAARLRHHAIVPIYDVGEADGTHYFSMEFIDGANLAAVMADPEYALHVLPGADRTTQIVEIVARIGDALHYAHDNGVLHRDVKPQNILIGHDGAVRLVDFGLARDTDRHSLSQSDHFAGTPYYASPEQIRGKRDAIDSRTDVFSLGVVLYELLARARPFDGETTQDIFDGIRDREPPALRRAARRLPHDLCVICHKALEKAPEDRYRTAGEFAADLRRFLRYEPILAHPPGALTRLSKAVRRNRLGVTAAAAIALLCIGGPLVLWRNSERLREQQLANAEALRKQELETAEALREQQRDHNAELRELLSDAVLALDVSQFRPGSEQKYLKRVAKLANSYDALAKTNTAPKVRYEATNVLAQLASAYLVVGNLERATNLYEDGIRRMRALMRDHPEDHTYLYGMGRLFHGRSIARRKLGDRNGSFADLQAAIEKFEQVDPKRLAPESQGLPERALARTYRSLGTWYVRPTTLTQARLVFEKALRLTRKIHAREPSSKTRLSVQLVHIDLGGIYTRQHQYDLAREHLESAIHKIQELRDEGTVHSIARYAIANAKNHLGHVSIHTGNLDRGIEYLRESAAIHAKLGEDFAGTLVHATNLVSVLRNLAHYLGRDPEGAEEALAIIERGLRVVRRAAAQSPSSFACQKLMARLHLRRADVIRTTEATSSEKAAEFKKAAAIFAPLTDRQPKNPLLYDWLGHAYFGQAYWQAQAGETRAALASTHSGIAAQERAVQLHGTAKNKRRLFELRQLLRVLNGARRGESSPPPKK